MLVKISSNYLETLTGKAEGDKAQAGLVAVQRERLNEETTLWVEATV